MTSGSGALTAEELRRIAHYDPKTGEFTCLVNMGRRLIGQRADVKSGAKDQPYFHLYIGGKRYFSHRMAWLWVHGTEPSAYIDHINGDTLDNRLVNLREATHQQNLFNRGANKNNTTGYKGVRLTRSGKKYWAEIKIDRKSKYLGAFDSAELAHQAYCAAAARLFGEFAGVA
jgi:hypothetical protein